jgi:hypothetical protein
MPRLEVKQSCIAALRRLYQKITGHETLLHFAADLPSSSKRMKTPVA